MKALGYILLVFGMMMIVSGINLSRTTYDLSSTHDFQKFMGGVIFSILLLAGGIHLIRKPKK